jgi:hypothetical protein
MDDLIPALDRLIAPVALRVVQSCTVDQDVDLAVTRKNRIGHALDRRGITDVERFDLGLAAGFLDRIGFALEHLCAATRQHHRGAASSQGLRAGQSDSGTRPGHPGDFRLQCGHGLLFMVKAEG